MKKILALLIPLFLSLAISCQADTNEEEPLTLMDQPQATANQPSQQAMQQAQQVPFYDIHGPVPFSPKPPYLLIAGISLVILLILAALYWFWKKRKKPSPPAVPPWDIALAELSEARNLFNASQSLLYMERVSFILRGYIESRFAIRSTRQTTREFLHKVEKEADSDPILQESRPELQTCLEQADMAKFAHRISDQENMKEMEHTVTAFVHKTASTPSSEGGKL